MTSLTGEEIQKRLAPFAARWSVYDESERSEAQTFVNELLACYGTHRPDVARFEEPIAGRFLDALWPTVCLIEMKAPKEAGRLDRHREQALAYWRSAGDLRSGIRAPRFVVICAFRRLEIWEPGAFPAEPRLALDLVELPERYDALLFLAGRDPVFSGHAEEVTREAAAQVADLYRQLSDRLAADPDVLRDFILQSVWCMFAEDLGMLDAHLFTRLVIDLREDRGRSSADDLGQLFVHLNDPSPRRPKAGRYQGVPYVDGGLFIEPSHVHLDADELNLLSAACAFDWRRVRPSIFGSLLEGFLGPDKQWALGAHYTHEADIQKVVQPTIVRPWRERIENLSTHRQAIAALNDLMGYVVLDPACGSGNFLYVAYRELRRLEARLREREAELRKAAGLKDQGTLAVYFPLANVRGIEIEGVAVSLARVTLWMGHKLAVDELGVAETTLPLVDLSGVQQADALRVPWPRADAIIGNPPFLGDRNLRGERGDDYVEWLKGEFGIGVKDYCVYWFRKAHQRLEPGGRAGLVGTNSISQNRAREATLEHLTASGGVIVDAVSKQPWPGEALVNVSIVNWAKQPVEVSTGFMLDGREVAGITSSLTETGHADTASAKRLGANSGRCFQGATPAGSGFVLNRKEASGLLLEGGAAYASVVRPYLIGRDISKDPGQRPSRFVIDFASRPLQEAEEFPLAMSIVRQRVKPVRDRGNDRRGFRTRWWQLGWPRIPMREALRGLSRFIASTATGKRLLLCWCEPATLPSNATTVFAFEDDYAMGVLSSRVHGTWARLQSSTLRVDIRYTPTSAFETFPWPPGATDLQRAAVGSAAVAMIERRFEICLAGEIGLTTLYNQVDEGAWTDLADLHRGIDLAVAAAYGWPTGIVGDDDVVSERLLALNHAIATGAQAYAPFAYLDE